MKKILLHNGNNNVVKAINKFLAKNLDINQTQILFNSWHNQLFEVYQKYQPDTIFWPSSEYSQELHDFITEYGFGSNVNIFLIVDVPVPQDQLNDFINQRDNIKIIKDSTIQTHYKNTIAEYSRLYDHEIFFDRQLSRNNKIIAILSPDNDRNHQLLDSVIYPNNYPVVVVNNPKFESVVNLGLINYNDLAFIMNTYSKIIDIDNIFALEATACNIDVIDISDNNIAQAIDQNKCMSRAPDYRSHTYEIFVKEKIIPHIGINIT